MSATFRSSGPDPRGQKTNKPAAAADHAEYVGNDVEKNGGTIVSEKSFTGAPDDFIHRIAQYGNITHNPLQDISREQCIAHASDWADKNGLGEDREYFIKGALLAQSGEQLDLTEEEQEWLEKEHTHKWAQPKTLYYMSVMCAMCAIVQGMDETVVNGAQTYFVEILGFNQFAPNKETWMQGLVVGAPYLACVVACAFTGPLNDMFGRRGCIFISCVIAAAASIWEAFTYSWVQLFIARLLLGIGIGPKSATVPVYSAESAPAPIRGALVMMWQMWTAFGIMFGYIMGVAFQPRDGGISRDTAWRLMLGSTVVAPILVCLQVYTVPESPRWYIRKNRYGKAFESLIRLRNTKVQAARDLYYMSVMIDINEEINRGRNIFMDIFKIGRNRRALYASQALMFMQQFCGVNVIAYYSTQIFLDANYSESQALLASMGFGLVNFFFALPAVFTIDTFGRRSLTLVTFPFLALFLLFTGFSFYIPDDTARIGCIALGVYLYTAFYSPGMGPVPFTYSAEAFPLHCRDMGMSMATQTLWAFNFILSLTWPPLLARLKPQGAFGYYAGWNVVGWLLCFFLQPETKEKTLEELDIIFSVPTSKFIRYQVSHIPYNLKRLFLGSKRVGPPSETLYDFHD